MNFLQAILIGIVEGITEFLPVSSTAHILLLLNYFNIEESQFTVVFNIVVQSAPVLAVLAIFFQRLKNSVSLWVKLTVAFVPTGLAGLLIYDYLDQLFTADIAVVAMFVTGVLFLVSEYLYRKSHSKKTIDLDEVTYWQAFMVGCCQILAIIPGVSRSGTTIIGGIGVGMNREVAIRFSFLLALPTMGASTGYSLLKEGALITSMEFSLMLVAFMSALLTSWFVIKLLLALIAKLSYTVFGIYLIASAAVFYVLQL